MLTFLFASFVAFSVLVAFTDWRKGWFLAILCGFVQDPVRKITPGTPVAMTFTVIVVYAAIIVAAHPSLRRSAHEISRRFPNLATWFTLLLFFLALGVVNGMFTYGIELWKVPFLSLFLYLAPLPALLLGYVYLQKEDMLFKFFRFYALMTSAALIGTLLEYMEVQWGVLGLVGRPGEYIRHLPGIQIRMLSGFFRGPDIMAWHAGTLTAISIALAVRSGLGRKAWPWMVATGWGFFHCMISGRRKAIYYVVVFTALLLWKYIRRFRTSQLIAMTVVVIILAIVVNGIRSDERTTVYAKGAMATRLEIYQRIEGGLIGTIQQFGILGAGLGTATQGVRHLLGGDMVGWQEGGVGKLAIELGIPGLIAALILAVAMLRLMHRIASFPDESSSSQLTRVTLFALVTANGINFIASAQAYTDPLLILLSAFFAGCLLGTAALEERTAPAPPANSPLTAPATA